MAIAERFLSTVGIPPEVPKIMTFSDSFTLLYKKINSLVEKLFCV
jgi:hypothetical protein